MMYLKFVVLYQGILIIEWLNKIDGCNNRYKNKIFSFFIKKKEDLQESENSFFSEKNS